MFLLLIRCCVCSLTGGGVKEKLVEVFYQSQTKTTRQTDKRPSVGADQPVTERRWWRCQLELFLGALRAPDNTITKGQRTFCLFHRLSEDLWCEICARGLDMFSITLSNVMAMTVSKVCFSSEETLTVNNLISFCPVDRLLNIFSPLLLFSYVSNECELDRGGCCNFVMHSVWWRDVGIVTYLTIRYNIGI